MTRRLHQLGLLVASLLVSLPAHALDPGRETYQYVHEKWNLAEGLPQSSVFALTQTSDGYIWMATAEGLARFDGVRFQVFDRSNTPGLKHNWIRTLIQDSRGDLWLGTNGGGITHFSGGRFRAYDTADGLSSNLVSAIAEDQQGNIWVGARKGGLFRLVNERFVPHSIVDDAEGLEIFSLFPDSKNRIWVCTNDGAYVLSGEKHKSVTTIKGLKSEKARVVYEDRHKTIWIGTHGGGLHRCNGDQAEVVVTDKDMTAKVTVLFEDRDGILWMGTSGAGLLRYQDGLFRSFSIEDGLSDDSVRSIFEDRESNLWVGTYSGGLNLLRNGKFTTFNSMSGLKHNIVFGVCEDPTGDLWVGTYGGGLYRYIEGKFHYQSIRPSSEPKRIAGLLCSDSGDVWVGTYDAGLFLMRGGKTVPFPGQHLVEKQGIPALYEDKDKKLWVGTNNDGLFVLHGESVDHYTTDQGLPANLIRLIYSDKHDNIWLGTDSGLVRHEDGKFKTFTTEHGLPNNVIFSVYSDQEDHLWIGTYGGGLVRYDGRDFNYVDKSHGLFDDVVYTILEDTAHNLWMTSNKGVYSVPKKQVIDFFERKVTGVHSTNYGIVDGLKAQECNGGFTPASCKTTKGDFLFPTVGGLSRIHPDKIPKNRLPPPVVIERFSVDGTDVEFTGEIELAPETRKIEVHYTALSYVAPHKTTFKFMLENFDSSWVEAQNRRVAYYTNLGPGNYRFRVIAANSDGFWNEQGATVAFRKKPYFYETAWFILTVLLTFLALLYALYRLRLHRIKQRNIELEGLVEERTEKLKEAHQLIVELEKETTERQMAGGFAHEIRNALAGANMMLNKIAHFTPDGQSIGETNNQTLVELFKVLKGRLEKDAMQEVVPRVKTINDNEKQADELVGKAHASVKRSLAVTEQILTYAQVGQEKQGGDEVAVDDLFDELQKEFEDTFVQHDIKLSVDGQRGLTIPGESVHFYTIFSNIIRNAGDALIMRTDRSDCPKEIRITINSTDQGCVIQVSDNGVGIAEEDIDRIFDPFFSTKPDEGTGLGMGMVKKYVTMYDGEIEIESTIHEGTAVVITLPNSSAELLGGEASAK